MSDERSVAANDPELLTTGLDGAQSFEDLAQAVARAGAEAAQAEICTVWRVYTDERETRRLRLAGSYGITQPATVAQEVTYAITVPNAKIFDGVTGMVASTRTSVLAHSFAELQERYAFAHRGKMDDIQWSSDPASRMRNLYAVPLILGSDIVGVLKVENHIGPASFGTDDVQRLSGVADRISILMKALVLLDSHERRLIEASANLSRALVDRPFETDQLMQDIVDQTAATLDAEVCSLWLVDSQGKKLVHQADFGFRGEHGAVPSYRIDFEPSDTEEGDREIDGITAWVAIRRKSFWANSFEALRKHPSWRGRWDPSMWGGKEEAAKRFRSMYATPLVWNNELLGVLKVENPKKKDAFSLNDRRQCDLMSNYIVLLVALTRQLHLQIIPKLSHNVLGPAGGIAVNLAQLARELRQQPANVDTINSLMDILKRLSLTVITLSRTLAGEVEAHVGAQLPDAVDLVKFLEAQRAFVAPIAPNGIQLKLIAERQNPVLRLKPLEQRWLEIVIFNLLHNAIKHSPEGGVVEVRCESKSGGPITISIGDHGPGVALEKRELIFEPGVTERVSGWPEGAGLGLYEVARLLTMLGWSRSVRDNHPRGALFTIEIPERAS